ncbi:hypothetical protein [Nocardia colli]|uniref:hypothetical protein n=1 Tax=Nocardia colli TaxID=2545717 RepID=UPI0035DBBD71
MLLIGAPAGWEIGTTPADVTVTTTASAADMPGQSADLAILFVSDTSALENSLDDALNMVPIDGLFWVAYRKGGAAAGSDLNRDTLQAHLAEHGVVGVMLISLDETWSGMRVRPITHLGRR